MERWQFHPEPSEEVRKALSEGECVAHYLGEAPWEIVDDAIRLVDQMLADQSPLSESEARRLVQMESAPPRLAALGSGIADRFFQIIADMWVDLDWCYKNAWGRPPLPVEKEALCLKAVGNLMTRSETPAENRRTLDISPPGEVRSYLRMLRDRGFYANVCDSLSTRSFRAAVREPIEVG